MSRVLMSVFLASLLSSAPCSGNEQLRSGAFVCKSREAMDILHQYRYDEHNRGMIMVMSRKLCFFTDEVSGYELLKLDPKGVGVAGVAKIRANLKDGSTILWTFPNQIGK